MLCFKFSKILHIFSIVYKTFPHNHQTDPVPPPPPKKKKKSGLEYVLNNFYLTAHDSMEKVFNKDLHIIQKLSVI